MSPSKFNSPVRTGTFKVQKKTEETPTTSTSYRTLYEVCNGDPQERVLNWSGPYFT